jgi:hypothetical protein
MPVTAAPLSANEHRWLTQELTAKLAAAGFRRQQSAGERHAIRQTAGSSIPICRGQRGGAIFSNTAECAEIGKAAKLLRRQSAISEQLSIADI